MMHDALVKNTPSTDRPPRLALTPAHLVRIAGGADVVQLRARGFGLVLGSLGVHLVSGSLETLVRRRFRSTRVRALFIGAHGVTWVSHLLPPVQSCAAPNVTGVRAPSPPNVVAPSLKVRVTVNPPEPP